MWHRRVTVLAVKQGHEVMVSNSRGPNTLFSMTFLYHCKADSIEEAAKFGDIVLIAILQSRPCHTVGGEDRH